MKKLGYLLAFGIMAAMLLTGCKKYTAKTGGMAVLACDETFENIMQQEIEVFEELYRQHSIIPYYIDESACVDSILKGHVQCAVLSRELTDKELEYLKSKGRTVYQQQIAVDAVALIVNPMNPLESLSMTEISEILSGEVTQWDQVVPGGKGDIQIVFDHQGSSTVKYVRDKLLGGKEFGGHVYAQSDNSQVFEIVESNKNAIGIVGVTWLTSDMKHPKLDIKERVDIVEGTDTMMLETSEEDFVEGIKMVAVRRDNSLDAYLPYQQYIYDAQYPLHRPMYMVSLGVPGSPAHSFYSFVTGVQGQKLILTTGVLPARLKLGEQWELTADDVRQ